MRFSLGGVGLKERPAILPGRIARRCIKRILVSMSFHGVVAALIQPPLNALLRSGQRQLPDRPSESWVIRHENVLLPLPNTSLSRRHSRRDGGAGPEQQA